MTTTTLAVRRKELRVEATRAELRALRDFAMMALSNPLISGLAALSLNEFLFRMGFYRPPGMSLRDYTRDQESKDKGLVGTALLAAMVAYAGGPKQGMWLVNGSRTMD